MEKIELDEHVVTFGKIIFEKSRLATHLAVGLSESTITFRDLPITISFNYVFVGFNLIGAEFDEFQFKNTKSSSGGIEVTSMWSDSKTKEISCSSELKFDLKNVAHGGTLGVAEKNTSQKEHEEKHKRTLPDLRIILNKKSKTKPQWKIFQINKSPLVLDPKESTKMAILDKISDDNRVELTGSIWTDRNGYNIDDGALTHLEKVNPVFRFHLALYKLMIKKRMKSSKLLHLAQVE